MENRGQIEGQTGKADEIHLLEVWRVLAGHGRMIVVFFLIVTLSTFGISLLLPRAYQATTTILPLESTETGLSSTLSALSGLAGIPIGKATPVEKFVAVLESRTVAESVIKKFNLEPELYARMFWRKVLGWLLRPPALEDAVKQLEQLTAISSDAKSSLITVVVEYRNPQQAAQIANAYIEELDRFRNANSLTLAKKKRLLLEKQIAQTKQDMKAAEEKLTQYAQKSKMLAPEVQAEATLKGLADLKAEIVSREVQLGVLKTYATPRNPEVQTLQEQVNMLRRQLAKLENGEKNPRGGGSDLSLASAPELALSFERLKRDVEFNGKMLEILVPQYELAKIEEAREDISFEVIDKAVPPVRPSKPRILLNTIFSGGFAIFFGCFLTFFFHYRQRV